jgi:hypothetical protein
VTVEQVSGATWLSWPSWTRSAVSRGSSFSKSTNSPFGDGALESLWEGESKSWMPTETASSMGWELVWTRHLHSAASREINQS